MAERLAELTAQIESVRQLEAVVTAMRGIAASRAQSGRSLLPGIDAYTQVVSQAIAEALSLLPHDGAAAAWDRAAGRGLILFCAEQGFAGAFSERVLDRAAGEPPYTTLLLLGTRGAMLARERGMAPAWTSPMATSANAVPDLASRLAETLYARIADDEVARVDIVYSRARATGGIEIERRSLLPLDYGHFKHPLEGRSPLTNLPPPVLLERLASEYIYAQLCQAAMQAFEAENEARMLTMGAARTNIQNKLVGLARLERRLRQQEITAEVLELSTGAEASIGSASTAARRRGHSPT
ncbi:MAG: F0F1 ATP synthase subunit gamma [Alphaproteobacteria bacterium]|nr:F0F1 ATP synthase subunit gamma [Alphaproteobacteria bacterium]